MFPDIRSIHIVILALLATGALIALWAADLIRRARILRRVRFSQPIELSFSWMHGWKVLNPGLIEHTPISATVATILQEDVDFFRHGGFQLREMLRSARITIGSRKLKGGSSISQQLVKRLCFVRPGNSLRSVFLGSWYRKLCEIPLTLYAESIFSKNEILSIYFDSANFGSCAIGLTDGAAVICRKPLARLNPGEILLLCFILIRPTRQNLRQLLDELPGSERARTLYERSLVIQRTVEGLGQSPLESLPFDSPYYFESLAKGEAEHARIEVATEAVHQFQEAAMRYLEPSMTPFPVHTTFLSSDQRAAMALVFGPRQNPSFSGNAAEVRSESAQRILAQIGLASPIGDAIVKSSIANREQLSVLASQYLDEGLGSWPELAHVIKLVNGLTPDNLPQQPPRAVVSKRPDPVLLLMGLCTQFTLVALPRDRYILPTQSASSRKFLAKSYGRLFAQLNLNSAHK